MALLSLLMPLVCFANPLQTVQNSTDAASQEDRVRQAIAAAYVDLRRDALAGNRNVIIPPFFQDNLGRTTLWEDAAIDRLIEIERQNPKAEILSIERYLPAYPRHATYRKVEVAYGADQRFEDLWSKGRFGGWHLSRRRPSSKRYENVRASDVAALLTEGRRRSLTIDPRIDRTVTVDLTGLPFEGAASRLADTLGAVYSVHNERHWIVPKNDDLLTEIDFMTMVGSEDGDSIERRCRWIVERIVRGQGAELRRGLDPSIDAEALIATVRAFPQWTFVTFSYVGDGFDTIESVVAHRNGNDEERRFRDLWCRKGDEWRWICRKPAAPNKGLDFYDARIESILTEFFAHHGQKLEVRPGIQGRTTTYLNDYDFHTGLSRLLAVGDLTYRIVEGRYVVSPSLDHADEP